LAGDGDMPPMTSAAALTPPLDLTRLPAFKLVDVSFEAEVSSLWAGIQTRMAARGISFDADQVESDPVAALVEEVAYRRTLALQDFNDAGKRLVLAYAYGVALDHIAVTFYADVGVQRLESEGYDVAGDDRFRRRILLAAEARTPGTLRGYEFHALTHGPGLSDALALNHASGLVAPGEIAIILLGGPDLDEDEETEQVELARAALLDKGVARGSDTLIIRPAQRVIAPVTAVLELAGGPDAALVLQEATRGLQAYAADRRRVGKGYADSGLKAALTVGGVDRVRLVTEGDVDPGLDGVVELGAVTLTTEASNA
jgi:phage-related baseplate assembly protein